MMISFVAPRTSAAYGGLNALQAVHAAIRATGYDVRVEARALPSGAASGHWQAAEFDVTAVDSSKDRCCFLRLRASAPELLGDLAARLRTMLPLVELAGVAPGIARS